MTVYNRILKTESSNAVRRYLCITPGFIPVSSSSVSSSNPVTPNVVDVAPARETATRFCALSHIGCTGMNPGVMHRQRLTAFGLSALGRRLQTV